jgi:hypothetical protein
MTTWLDALENPLSISEAFGDVLPTADGIELSSVHLGKVGPELRLNFDLVEFPENPPANWTEGSNTANLTIALAPVSTLVFDGTDFGDIVTMTLARTAGGVQLRIQGESLTIEADAGTATVTSLVGGRDERRLPPS